MTYHEQKLALMRERERLIAQCARQRAEIAADTLRLRGMFSVTDRVMAGVRYVRARPAWFAVAAGALFMLRSRGIWQILKRGFTVWRVWRTLRTAGEHGDLGRRGMFERFFAAR